MEYQYEPPRLKATTLESYTDWIKGNANYQYRTWKGVIWRKEISRFFYGGSQIKYIRINTRIGREWLILAKPYI